MINFILIKDLRVGDFIIDKSGSIIVTNIVQHNAEYFSITTLTSTGKFNTRFHINDAITYNIVILRNKKELVQV
jgi:hypothetical protein